VGTGGPIQTVYHNERGVDGCDINCVTTNDKEKYGQRGDQPGYMITQGQLRNFVTVTRIKKKN
jgi:hypothetical protein